MYSTTSLCHIWSKLDTKNVFIVLKPIFWVNTLPLPLEICKMSICAKLCKNPKQTQPVEWLHIIYIHKVLPFDLGGVGQLKTTINSTMVVGFILWILFFSRNTLLPVASRTDSKTSMLLSAPGILFSFCKLKRKLSVLWFIITYVFLIKRFHRLVRNYYQ